MKLLFTNSAKYLELLLFALVLAFLIAVSGCSAYKSNSGIEVAYDFEVIHSQDKVIEWPDSDFEERFSKYWGLRFEGETGEIYKMEAPYFRAVVPEGQHRNYVRGTSRNTLKSIEIFDKKKRTDHFFEISMRLHFITESGNHSTTDRRDRWVKVDDDWYHIIRNQVIFPQIS